MATTNYDLQMLTQPGSTGPVDYDLADGFDPIAIKLWGVPGTSDGLFQHLNFCLGFGTYRGGSVQQRCAWVHGVDAANNAALSRGQANDAVFQLLHSTDTATPDLNITLTSLTTGSGSKVTLNWTNLHTTASIRIFMEVFGGDAISDALVSDFTMGTGSTTQDVTVVSGFGKPEFVFFAGNGTISAAQASPKIHWGFAKQGEAGRGFGFSQVDGDTASLTAVRQRADRCILSILATGASSGTDEALGRLDTTVANWPTDGFRVLWDANPANADVVSYLALRTTAQIATGADSAPTAGTPPVTQDDDVGFTPKGAYLFGWNLTTNTGLVTADSTQVGVGMGAYDGTTEGWAGFTEDDAAGTMDSNSQQVDDKIIRNYTQAAALTSEADGVFTGTTFRRSWGDLGVASEHQWVVFGDSALVHSSMEAVPGSYAVTGSAAGLLSARLLKADPGSYSLTGFAATLTQDGRVLVVDPGSYAVTGAAATLLGDRILKADPGSYALTGAAATLAAARLFSVDPGVYVVTGFEAELSHQAGFFLDAEPGSYSLTGAAATLAAARLFNAAPGSYVVTGVQASLLAQRLLSVDPGSLVVTGASATLLATHLLGATPGSYAVTGSPAALLAARLLDLGPGAYVIVGLAADLKSLIFALPPVTPGTGTTGSRGRTDVAGEDGATTTTGESGRTDTDG